MRYGFRPSPLKKLTIMFILLPACHMLTSNMAVYQRASPGIVHISAIILKNDFPVSEATGSGFIIDSQGHILTNDHLLKGAHRIQVKLSDGSRWDGNTIGRDGFTDLAVIRIKAPPERLQLLPLGDSDRLQIGQKVLAMGNPFGRGGILTAGIISSLGTFIHMSDGTVMGELIQTDAAITPHNSGGPLLDAGGRVIGINVTIISSLTKQAGLGFVIPVNTAKRILPELIGKGYVSCPWIGAYFMEVDPNLAQALDLQVDRGLLVSNIVEGGPADLAGLKGWQSDFRSKFDRVTLRAGGDVVIAVDETPVESVESMIRVLLEHKPGDSIMVKVLRDGGFMEVQVILGKRRSENHVERFK